MGDFFKFCGLLRKPELCQDAFSYLCASILRTAIYFNSKKKSIWKRRNERELIKEKRIKATETVHIMHVLDFYGHAYMS